MLARPRAGVGARLAAAAPIGELLTQQKAGFMVALCQPKAVLLQYSNDNALNLKEISESCGITYARARVIVAAPGVSQYLGGFQMRGEKGDRYPASCLTKMQQIIDAMDRKLVTPKTIGAWLARMESPADESQPSGTAPTRLPAAPAASMQSDPALIEALQAIARVVSVPVEDSLIDRIQAAQLLACSPRSVVRYVKPVRAGTHPAWKRSDILRYIESL